MELKTPGEATEPLELNDNERCLHPQRSGCGAASHQGRSDLPSPQEESQGHGMGKKKKRKKKNEKKKKRKNQTEKKTRRGKTEVRGRFSPLLFSFHLFHCCPSRLDFAGNANDMREI
jgi:hypothetical protein